MAKSRILGGVIEYKRTHGAEEMNEKIKHFVEEVKEYLIKTYGEKIKQVMVYGSYARGEATEESDIDVLIVVDDSLNPFAVRKSLSDILFDILLENGELISVIAIPESFFKNYNSPFLLNVKEEGVAV
ncbi:MAG: nucleotidyltransferase domain-containing protein [Methanophagales archaeon]|nr:nucleotidyltransferase domain-containing protein [Methanophagales archaeon]